MSLNVVDLDTMEQIIRNCQSRGSFRMEEMPIVSELYGKIVQILKQEQFRQSVASKQLHTITEEKKE